jgi:hypothetical protein
MRPRAVRGPGPAGSGPGREARRVPIQRMTKRPEARSPEAAAERDAVRQ